MMNFTLDEEHASVREMARQFAHNELLPGVIERDKEQRFPREQIAKMGELGMMGMIVSSKYGGGGMDTLGYVIAIEEIAKVDASAAVCMSVNNSLVCSGIEAMGSDTQKEKYLHGLATGNLLGAFCLSEPEAGSDATSQRTIAEDKGDYYLLNGVKNWITNGNTASVYMVIAQSDPKLRHRGINALIVDRAAKGVAVGKKEDKMGIRGSDTHSITFTNVRVPKANRLGDEGSGFRFAMNTLNRGRIGIAAQAVGIAAGAYEHALQYSKERKAFGKLLCQHQAIQFKLAEMATKVDAARLLTWRAAYMKDRGENFVEAAATAKLYASQIAQEVTTEAVQIHGGYGYVKEYHVERLMRDAKITQIYEGTSEIQKIVIARELLK